MSNQEKTIDLNTKLSNEAKKYRRIARIHALLLTVMYSTCIVSSLASTILVSSDYLPKIILAVLVALPGTTILCATSFRFKDHAQWHYIKARRIENIQYALNYEDMSISEVSKQIREMHEHMESTWPSFGKIVQEESQAKANV